MLIVEIIKDICCLGVFVYILINKDISNWWTIIPIIGMFSTYKYNTNK